MDLAPAGFELFTPGGQMRWGDCEFELNPPPGGDTDFAVVLFNARPFDRFTCAPENTLFIAGEPLEKKVYAQSFYRQFAHVVDTHAMSGHPGLILGAPGLNWHVGLNLETRTYRYGYDHLAALPYPAKKNLISVVCSDANKTPGQRRRLALLDQLKQRLGDRLVHFGKGFEPIVDKMDAILPYRLHLVLENSQAPNYWTEKLADAYLGWAYPVYLGAPNLGAYFPSDGYLELDANNVDATAAKIICLLDQPPPTGERDAIATARRLVLDKYNPFAWSAHWAQALYRQSTSKELTLRIQKAFRPFPKGALYRLRNALNGSLSKRP